MKKLLTIIFIAGLVYAILSTFFYGYNDLNNLIFIPLIGMMVAK